MLDEISEILHLHRSSIYKKLSGEIALSLEETEVLCKHFRISLDEILGLINDKIYFDFPALYGSVSNEVEYLEPIKSDLEKMNLLNPLVYYATKELPIFYYFASPRLIAFKLHVFYNFVWRKENHAPLKFDFNKYNSDLKFKSLVSSIQEAYASLNSIEIWNTSILDNTFNQLKYFLDSGFMVEPNESLLICDDIERLIEKIESMIHHRNKSAFRKSGTGFGSIELYNNEIAHTNNVIFVQSETRDAVYCTYDNPNFMRSISPVLCEYTAVWFERLIANSIPITGGGIKEKNQFINRLKEKLNRTKISLHTSLTNLDD